MITVYMTYTLGKLALFMHYMISFCISEYSLHFAGDYNEMQLSADIKAYFIELFFHLPDRQPRH